MSWLIKELRLGLGDKIQLILSYFLQLIILSTSVFLIIKKEWLNAVLVLGILILTTIPALVRRNYKIFLPVEFDLITIVFVFAAVFLGEWHSYYRRFWWWDIILHLSSGFLLGIAGLLLVYILNEQKKIHLSLKPGFISLFGLAFAISLGTVWEIFEFSLDQLFNLEMQRSGLVDTMWDLIVDTIGGMIIAILGYFYLKKGKMLLFDRMIHRFIEYNPRLFRETAQRKP